MLRTLFLFVLVVQFGAASEVIVNVAIGSIRNGSDARSYSSASAEAIPIFRSGMDALWRARLHNGEIVMMNRGSEAESHG
jgi:hypothetical protein